MEFTAEQTRDLIEALAPYAANRASDTVALAGDCAPLTKPDVLKLEFPTVTFGDSLPPTWSERVEALEQDVALIKRLVVVE